MPRGLRTALRVVLLVLGGLVLVLGGSATVLIGSDDTAQTGPHDVFTPGVAILTDAEALHYVGPTLHLTVEREDGAPVFVGVAHEVDVASYVSDRSRREVSRVKLPWSPTATETGAGVEPLPAPGQQPWWIDSVEGSGPQELVWPIPNGRYSIAVLNADGSPAVDVQLTLGLELEGAFATTLAVTVFGLALVLLGVWLWIRNRRRRAPAVTVEPDPTYGDQYHPYVAYAPTEPAQPTESAGSTSPPQVGVPSPAPVKPRPPEPGTPQDEVRS